MSVGARGAAKKIAEDMVAFGPVAAFDIAQHRGHQRRTRSRNRGPRSLEERRSWGKTLMGCDGGAFIEERRREVRCSGGDDVADSRPHEAGDARGRGDEDPFFPHFLPDCGAEARVEIRAGQRRRNPLDPLRKRTVKLAEGQRMNFVEVDDRALRAEGRRDHTQAAEHSLRAEAIGKDVELPHAVQEGQNRRVRAHRLGERRHGALEIVGLAAQKDEVEGVGEALFRNERRGRMMEVAEAAAKR